MRLCSGTAMVHPWKESAIPLGRIPASIHAVHAASAKGQAIQGVVQKLAIML